MKDYLILGTWIVLCALLLCWAAKQGEDNMKIKTRVHAAGPGGGGAGGAGGGGSRP